jgi:hypothetical protein
VASQRPTCFLNIIINVTASPKYCYICSRIRHSNEDGSSEDMVNPAVVSFWLDNKRVNGTSIAEDGPVKLVRYGSKLYVVEGKDAERRSYSQTSLPPKWKKILSATKALSAVSGAAAPSGAIATAPAASPKLKPSETPATTVKRTPTPKSAAALPEKPGISPQPSGKSQITHLQPEAPLPSPVVTAQQKITQEPRAKKANAKKTGPVAVPEPTPQVPAPADTVYPDITSGKGHVNDNFETIDQKVETDMPNEKENVLVADTVNNQAPASKLKKAKTVASVPAAETAPAPEAPVKAKPALKAGKSVKAKDKSGDLDCTCPYCQHKKELMLADAELGKPVIVICAGCAREYVLRVVMTYQVQVAGFI